MSSESTRRAPLGSEIRKAAMLMAMSSGRQSANFIFLARSSAIHDPGRSFFLYLCYPQRSVVPC